MNSLKEKIVNISSLIEKQLPSFVAEENPKFISFLSSYYESQEVKFGSLDLVSNLIDYYNIGYYNVNTLIEYTTLTSNISDVSTTLSVSNTAGFPEKNGYIDIDGEIIFYRTKTDTQFIDCVRATSAFVVETVPATEVVYKTGSKAVNHVAGQKVYNISYTFVKVFLDRIKSEISPNLPEILATDLNLLSFLKNIKSFYLAKGSERSHQLLFRILFNDKKVKLRLKSAGSGAKIDILNYSGNISSFELLSGGSGYYYELENGNLVSPPIIDIIGSGTGAPNQSNIVPDSAKMVVATMIPDASGTSGTISSVSIQNAGRNYVGPIRARVRPRSFFQNQKIYNVDSNQVTTASARVETWDPFTNELTLTDVIGYFKVDDKIIGEGGENPRAYVSKAYPVTDINREGNPSIQVIPETPRIEYPKNQLFKPSSASLYVKRIIRCELLKNYSTRQNLSDVNLIRLIQSRDLLNRISGVTLDISEISQIGENLYEFEVDDKFNYKKLYLPSSTKLTSNHTITQSSSATINVTSTFNFPHKKGKLFIGNRIVKYESKTNTQFIGCKLAEVGSLTITTGTNVYLYGRDCLTSGEVSYFIKGYVDGEITPSVLFKLHALPSEPVIVNSGALYSSDVFELDPELTYKLQKTKLSSKKYGPGEIEEVLIENPGNNYKINDRLVVNEKSNLGSGFRASISSIKGRDITSYEIYSINDRSCIVFTTSSPHNLNRSDVVKFNNFIGNTFVYQVISSTKFAVENTTNINILNILNLSYVTNSKTALGSIDKITITNRGKNYNKLPEVTGVNSTTGYGAVIQLNSNSIGKITKFQYSSIGDELIGTKSTQYEIITASTAKVLNNFQISNIEVISGGKNYNTTTDKIKIDGVVIEDNNPDFKFQIIASSGVIKEIKVIKGGFNLNYTPEISIESSFGTECILRANISRKIVETNDILSVGASNSTTKIKVVNFDSTSSTLEYSVVNGTVAENAVLYTNDGRIYGNIKAIKKCVAYCRLSPYATYSYTFLDNFGFVSDSTQKLLDSDYNQEWSYTLVSTRNTSEWKNQVIQNTHPAGYRLFGKNVIENKEEFFKRPEDVFNSNVLFKSTLKNDLNLKLNPAKCITQKVAISDVSQFNVGSFVYGNFSEATGIIQSINENYIEIQLYSEIEFIFGEYIFEVTRDFVALGNEFTKNSLLFSNGVLQTPYESYLFVNNSIIPKFTAVTDDDIISHTLTNEYKFLYYQILQNGTSINLLDNTQSFSPTSKNQLIISINGIIQSPSAFTLTGSIVEFNSNIVPSDKIFILYQPNFKALTFTGSGSTYTLNYTPASSCNLIIFANNVFQSNLITNFSVTGNQLNLSESVTSQNLVGWYIDEAVSCYLLNYSGLNNVKIIDVKSCDVKKVTQFVESTANKSPKSIYEITKDLLSGTVLADADNTTVYGYDTKFISSNPEYSTSYVEVLNPIIFNGTSKTFNLTYMNGVAYTPVNGETNLIVNIDNNVLDHDQYSVSGSTITFVETYTSSNKCTIIDFNSGYLANNVSAKGANLDRLNVIQNASRKTFNLSDRGVPQYTKNTGDVFAIKNNSLLRPDSQTHSVSQNKITFQTAPVSSDVYNILHFNRQLSPVKTKNVLLDTLQFFDGVRTTWPISVDGILFAPISVYHLFVVRNGVYQKPGIDYTISGTNITFSEAPILDEDIYAYYAYNGLDQNFVIDTFKQVDGVRTTFALTTNYVSSQVVSSTNLIISRNGVYQNPTLDYSVGGTTNARYIQFNTPITTQEPLHIVNYKSNDLVNVTSRFTQYNTTTLQYTSQTPAINTSTFLIFVNGILQVGDSWSFDTATNRLIFTGFVSLSLDNVTILAFQNQKRIFDKITATSGVETYSLKVNTTTITTNLPSASDLIVSIDGVYQLPFTAYSVSGSSITIPGITAGSEVYIYQLGTQETEIIDYFDDNYSKSTYKLLSNYGSVNPVEVSDILFLRNGVVQNPGVDYTVGNGFITFTTNITPEDEIYLLYCHGNDKIAVTNISGTTITLASSIPSNQYKDIIVYLDGTNQFYQQNFTISGNTITLSENTPISNVFVIKNAPITNIDQFDDYTNGTRTKFRTYYNNANLIAADIVTDADILISINGRIQHPGVQYTLSAQRGMVYFTQAPNPTDVIFMVRMHGNTVVNLTATGTNNRYTLSQSISTIERPNLCIFGTTQWCFEELQNFSYVNTNTVDLNITQNAGSTLFGIKFEGLVKLLDQINTPYNGSNTRFNMFLNEQNFMPVGTIENDSTPSESSIIVTKNGKILDPAVEYTLQGDIKSQIQFTVAPISTDVISVKAVGSFLKLNSITSGFGGKVYNMKKIDNSDYYPNKDIDRPRKHENQILVIRNGSIQSPLYDYYIDNNKIVFMNNVTGTNKLVVMDFRGTKVDTEVNSTSYQISTGDKIRLAGENSDRIVTQVISPTVLKTQTYSGSKPSGFVGTVTTTDGKTTNIGITNGGKGYEFPVILRTVGVGVSSKSTATINAVQGNSITTPVTIQYPGYNQYSTQTVIPTCYAYSYKQKPINTSNVKIGTKLSSNINSSVEIIPILNGTNFEQSTISITVSSSTGSGATFRPFVSKGRIRKIEILSSGIGYNEKDAILIVTGGGGSGCVLEPIFDAMGSLTSLNIKNSGEGYDTYRVIIDTEIIEYTNILTNTQLVGCTRASSPASHSQNSIVYFDKFL